MRIDRSRLRRSTSEVPSECRNLILRLKTCSQPEFLNILKSIDTWTYGKCELYHWIDVLDICDSILESAASRVPDDYWTLSCDLQEKKEEKELLLWVLHFTTLLIEHSFSRHLYNSMEHLITLLSSCDMNVVLGVLNLLYMFSKRSNFITRLSSDKRQALLSRLTYLAESWGGKDNGFGLADCCKNLPETSYPASATTVHCEFYSDTPINDGDQGPYRYNSVTCVHIPEVDKLPETPAKIMRDVLNHFAIPEEKQMQLFTLIRLAHCFPKWQLRLLCVQARLQALSVLVYSNALGDNAHSLLYSGLLEELVELLQLSHSELVEIRAAALRTLTSIIHLDRNPHFPKKPGSRLNMIIEVTEAAVYHGFLPSLVRDCIMSLTVSQEGESSTSKPVQPFPLPLATALFSFLYHLASYEPGGEALVNCGMMESLLRVVKWQGTELEHITFVTRAVRVIDLVTNIDMQAFQGHGGLTCFVNRLEVEVAVCHDDLEANVPRPNEPVVINLDSDDSEDETAEERTCLPQRAALLKSMLNFLKKAIQDPSFGDSTRYVMEGSLPTSLKHIISHSDYYGSSLFLLATDVVTVYVFQEPSFLSFLQDNGLTDAVLDALLVKDVPPTREVLGSLPNVFSALCLNKEGLQRFVKQCPFDKLLRVLITPKYLSAMKRRRNADPLGDTATSLGNAMDELMRHQPILREQATQSIIMLLEELISMGNNPRYICCRGPRTDSSPSPAPRQSGNNDGGSSDEEDDEEEEASSSSHQRDDANNECSSYHEKTPIALTEYIVNVMKFVDAILSNNNSEDHCREFIGRGGVQPLLNMLGLPNLPTDLPNLAPIQAIASVCKTIMTLANEPDVLQEALVQMSPIVMTLRCLITDRVRNSTVLLHEIAQNASRLNTAFTTPAATPILHAMSAAHGYIMMFVNVCRTGQPEMRSLIIRVWSSDLGLSMLNALCEIYSALVWESTLLLGLCSEDMIIPDIADFGAEDLKKIVPDNMMETESSGPSEIVMDEDDDYRAFPNPLSAARMATDTSDSDSDSDCPNIRSNRGRNRRYNFTRNNFSRVASRIRGNLFMAGPSRLKVDELDMERNAMYKKNKNRRRLTAYQFKYLKPLLGASSRLGRALAELFGLLVKLSVGSPMRIRRGQQIAANAALPSPAAVPIMAALNKLLCNGLDWRKVPDVDASKFKVTYLICSIGFTSPMLFDDKKYPYHLMLQRFVTMGGLQRFFETFRWVITSAWSLLPVYTYDEEYSTEGLGEFLDAWLLLLEKMVNPRTISDSPHSLEGRHGPLVPFEVVGYLSTVHKMAFDALMFIWGKKPFEMYGNRITQSMLTILRHILLGEKMLEERRRESDFRMRIPVNPSTSSSSSSFSTGPTPSTSCASSSSQSRTQPVNASYTVSLTNLERLLEMGFSRSKSVEALRNFTTLEQAMEYLLNNPPSASPTPTMDEHDEMIRAIALSLGDKIMADCDQKDTSKGKVCQEDDAYLSRQTLETFSKSSLRFLLDLCDMKPELVPRVSELVITVMERNGQPWTKSMLAVLAQDIKIKLKRMYGMIHLCGNAERFAEILANENETGTRVSGRIHLTGILMMQCHNNLEIGTSCAVALLGAQIPTAAVQLLTVLAETLSCVERFTTPLWVGPLLMLLDSLQRVADFALTRTRVLSVTNRAWRWYDLSTGRWSPYSCSNNEILNRAYFNGESSARISCAGRRYQIHFNVMQQMNEETLTRRLITMQLKKYNGNHFYDDYNVFVDSCPSWCLNKFVTKLKKERPIQGLEEPQLLIRICVRLLQIPISSEHYQAMFTLMLRLTRRIASASEFVECGGVEVLLNLKQAQSFPGYLSLSTMIIRHLLEEPCNLTQAMERVLRARTLPNIPPAYKELMYLFRNVHSAISRDEDTFFSVARCVLRRDSGRASSREDQHCIMKTAPHRKFPPMYLEEGGNTRSVMTDLLNALIRPPVIEMEEDVVIVENDFATDTEPTSLSGRAHLINRRERDEPRNSSTDMGLQDPDDRDLDFRKIKEDSVQYSKGPEDDRRRFLLPNSAILKLLSEIVRSYPSCAKLITEHQYTAGQSDLITRNCTAVAFILDKLLPVDENNYDKECPAMARMLIAALASCNHSVSAQAALVSEVKFALLRTLYQPESPEKHAHLQLLTGLISTMIDNCPSAPGGGSFGATIRMQYTNQVNNIVKMMLRKGLVTDLARVAHYLDLSNPNLSTSVNAALKPLETLSRLVNEPTNTRTKKVHRQRSQDDVSEEASGGQRDPDLPNDTSNSEATEAQEDETAEDTETTDNESTTGAEISNGIEVAGSHLEDLMETIIDGQQANENRRPELNAEHDQAAVPGNEEQAEDINQADDQNPDSQSESSQSDDGNDGTGIDSTERGDDNEEDEEEVGSGYEEDGLQFLESEEGLFRIPALNRNNEDILMIQYSDPDPSVAGPLVPWNNTFQLPFGILEDPANGNDNTAIYRNHPLFMARRNLDTMSVQGRAQRTNRQRRAMGPAVQEVPIQHAAVPAAFRDAARVVVMDNGIGLYAHEEEQIDFVDQAGYLFGPSLSAVLNATPTPLQWWSEESRLLDADAGPDIALVVASRLMNHMFRRQSQEMAERREKRKRQQSDDEETRKRKDDENKTFDQNAEMEVVVNNIRAFAAQRQQLLYRMIRPSDVLNGINGTLGSILSDREETCPVHTSEGSYVQGQERNERQSTPIQPHEQTEQRTRENWDGILEQAPTQVSGSGFSDLTSGLLNSLSEILPTVNAASHSSMGGGTCVFPDVTNSNAESNVNTESYPNTSMDSTQLGSMMARCNTATPGPSVMEAEAEEFPEFMPNSQSQFDNLLQPTTGEDPEEFDDSISSSQRNIDSNFQPMQSNRRNAREYKEEDYAQSDFERNTQTDFQLSAVNSTGGFRSEDSGYTTISQQSTMPCFSGTRNDRFESYENFTSTTEHEVVQPETSLNHPSTSASSFRYGFPALPNTQAAASTGNCRNYKNENITPATQSEENTTFSASAPPAAEIVVGNEDEDEDEEFMPEFTPSSRTESPLIPVEYIFNENVRPQYEGENPNVSNPQQQSMASNDGIFTVPPHSVAEGDTIRRTVQILPRQPIPNEFQFRFPDNIQVTFHRQAPSFNAPPFRPLFRPPSFRAQTSTVLEGLRQARHDRNLQEALDTFTLDTESILAELEEGSDASSIGLEFVSDARTHVLAPGALDLDVAAETWLRSQVDARIEQQLRQDQQATPHTMRLCTAHRNAIHQLSTSTPNPPPTSTPNPAPASGLAPIATQASTSTSENGASGGAGSTQSMPQETASNSAAGTSSRTEVPEGVDPSFLAALPDDVREEVVAQQLRLQRLRQRHASHGASSSIITEVSAEFLAALPANIQEEVLAQQRLEQLRLAAATANPNEPIDARTFFQNLQPSLRQAILTDIEESQIPVLPPEFAQEAQNLRRQWEVRSHPGPNHFITHVNRNNSGSTSILRTFGSAAGRVGPTRYAIHTFPQRTQAGNWSGNQEGQVALRCISSSNLRVRGRQLLDHEAMTCLIVMIFVNEPKLNTGRLHRVLRNLCYHIPTRDWLAKALLSIADKSIECFTQEVHVEPRPHPMSRRSQYHPEIAVQNSATSWLNIGLDAALGCRASVFNVIRHVKRSKGPGTVSIRIHPQAAQLVFRHTLEVLTSLARSFPEHFLIPFRIPEEEQEEESQKSAEDSKTNQPDPPSFWDMLLKLDSLSTTKKGKSVTRAQSGSNDNNQPVSPSQYFEVSPFGRLLLMLETPMVKRSTLLTDKLLRLLALISTVLADDDPQYLHKYEAPASKKPCDKEIPEPVPERFLKIGINVLTSKSCSEEGLEDATILLLNMSNCPYPTRDNIIKLLLSGTYALADMVNDQVGTLLKELRVIKQKLKKSSSGTSAMEWPAKGIVQDRFTKDTVVVTAPKLKTGGELHLPCMTVLTSKTSSQAFFLRILKVISQIRESMITIQTKFVRREVLEQFEAFRSRHTASEEAAASASRTESIPAPAAEAVPSTTSRRRRRSSSNAGSSHPRRAGLRSSDAAGSSSASSSSAISMPTDTPMSASNALYISEHIPGAPVLETGFPGQPPILPLSEQLSLDYLWDTLSACLLELEETPDHYAVLVLQPAVEAFFLVHSPSPDERKDAIRKRRRERYPINNRTGGRQSAQAEVALIQPEVVPVTSLQPDSEGNIGGQASGSIQLSFNWETPPSPVTLPPDQQKFLRFAELHRTVLNQILRQSTTHLVDGPFSVLVDHTRVLDFDVKRRYFRSELERMDEGLRREEMPVPVKRASVFEDSFRVLHRRTPNEWKNRFYIVFEGEEGQDAGGLLREWYMIISREIFNPNYALFRTSPGDRVTYTINPSSHCNSSHLMYFKFVGRVIAKAVYDNKLLECYFTRSFYKHILGILVKYTDMESEDYAFYQGLIYLMENHISEIGTEITFSTEVQEFGVTDVRDLIPNGRYIQVSEQNKMDYIRLVCQMKMTGAIRQQMNAFLEGFYDIIPKGLISIFNEQELELLISGLPNVDVEELRANTEYHKYQPNSLQIQWFWRALRSFDQADRAKFLQFVTGTSKVPLQGFAALEGMNGVQKFQIHRDDRSTDRLPSAHTCFNQLDLPVYETYDKLRSYLQKAIHECSEGFGFA